RAQESRHLARPDEEGQMVDSHSLAVALGEADSLDHERFPSVVPAKSPAGGGEPMGETISGQPETPLREPESHLSGGGTPRGQHRPQGTIELRPDGRGCGE